MLNVERFFIHIRMSFSASNNLIIVTVVVSRLCVSVRSFLPPCASRPRNIGTYIRVHRAMENFYIIVNRDFC